MLRIATVYQKRPIKDVKAYAMDTVRWLKISEALARAGFKVDMIVAGSTGIIRIDENLRLVSEDNVDWCKYDIIKTLFHEGFEFLIEQKRENHPFIISKLGSVVGRSDSVEGVYFYGELRKHLYEIQNEIAKKSRYVTILTPQSVHLWEEEYGQANNILVVPTGVDKHIPAPGENPYQKYDEKIAVYIGNIYKNSTQVDINVKWQESLNRLGRLLKKRGIRLCMVGEGDISYLDQSAVTYLGKAENHEIWNYQYYAHVGIVLAQGKTQHNESSKIYYYLRTGLPVVCEDSVPNINVIQEANLGFVSTYGDYYLMADMIEEAIFRKWDRMASIEYILQNHTWDIRIQRYCKIIAKDFRRRWS